MKKISTLGFGILFSLASFANYAPTRLTVSAEGNNNIKVTVDGNRFEQQSYNNSVQFENLEPGFHNVKVFQLTQKRVGFFGMKTETDYKLIYASSISIKPMFATAIDVNRFGRAQVSEQPLRGLFDNRGWDNRRDDRRDDRNNGGFSRDDRNLDYGRTLKDDEFFAARRVMQRENDDTRLIYAKHLVNENYLSAAQVRDLAQFFSFDGTRLDFAKYAYTKTIDKSNYNTVCNAFTYENSRQQLMDYVRTCR